MSKYVCLWLHLRVQLWKNTCTCPVCVSVCRERERESQYVVRERERYLCCLCVHVYWSVSYHCYLFTFPCRLGTDWSQWEVFWDHPQLSSWRLRVPSRDKEGMLGTSGWGQVSTHCARYIETECSCPCSPVCGGSLACTCGVVTKDLRLHSCVY